MASKVQRDLQALRKMPDRLNDLQLAEVEQIARSPVAEAVMTDDQHLANCLLRMDSNLKRRSDGEGSEKTAALRIDTQRKVLLQLPREQLSFITAEAVRRLTFFPSIAEMLEIGKEWKNPNGGAQRLARTMVMHERMRRQREAAKRLKFEEVPQKDIDAWPEWLCERLAEERLLARCEDCGSFAQQNYHWRDYQNFLASQEMANG